MKALEVVEREGAYVSRLVSALDPRPNPGEVVLRVAASGVNRADLMQIAGHYPPPAGEPEILGLEVSGTREDTGERVSALLAGGGHAERVAVPTGQIFPAPPGMTFLQAAAIPEVFLTAFLNLVIEGGLKKGDALLVHAGASGVGLASIQMGKLLGARVAATTRSAEKIAALEQAGSDLAIDTSRERFDQAIPARWGSDAVAVILDPIGADSLSGNLSVLSTGGRVIILATLSGRQASLDLAGLMHKRGRIIGSMLRARPRPEKAVIVERFRREVLPAFEDGRLRVTIDSVFPPERAAEAFRRMSENRNTGKIVIDWTQLNR
jgi:putative PIG3 family NAD(P)H quinone oxidoreductase